MKKVIEQLQRIAKSNRDRFIYQIEINPSGKEIRYTFVVTEEEEGHTFICVDMPAGNIEDFSMSQFVIQEACQGWDYKFRE